MHKEENLKKVRQSVKKCFLLKRSIYGPGPRCIRSSIAFTAEVSFMTRLVISKVWIYVKQTNKALAKRLLELKEAAQNANIDWGKMIGFCSSTLSHLQKKEYGICTVKTSWWKNPV